MFNVRIIRIVKVYAILIHQSSNSRVSLNKRLVRVYFPANELENERASNFHAHVSLATRINARGTRNNRSIYGGSVIFISFFHVHYSVIDAVPK